MSDSFFNFTKNNWECVENSEMVYCINCVSWAQYTDCTDDDGTAKCNWCGEETIICDYILDHHFGFKTMFSPARTDRILRQLRWKLLSGTKELDTNPSTGGLQKTINEIVLDCNERNVTSDMSRFKDLETFLETTYINTNEIYIDHMEALLENVDEMRYNEWQTQQKTDTDGFIRDYYSWIDDEKKHEERADCKDQMHNTSTPSEEPWWTTPPFNTHYKQIPMVNLGYTVDGNSFIHTLDEKTLKCLIGEIIGPKGQHLNDITEKNDAHYIWYNKNVYNTFLSDLSQSPSFGEMPALGIFEIWASYDTIEVVAQKLTDHITNTIEVFARKFYYNKIDRLNSIYIHLDLSPTDINDLLDKYNGKWHILLDSLREREECRLKINKIYNLHYCFPEFGFNTDNQLETVDYLVNKIFNSIEDITNGNAVIGNPFTYILEYLMPPKKADNDYNEKMVEWHTRLETIMDERLPEYSILDGLSIITSLFWTKKQWENIISDFYMKYNVSKLTDVPYLLEKYKFFEPELLLALYTKYDNSFIKEYDDDYYYNNDDYYYNNDDYYYNNDDYDYNNDDYDYNNDDYYYDDYYYK